MRVDFDRWQVGPDVNRAVKHLARTDPAYAEHARAERLVQALGTLFGVKAMIAWGDPQPNGNLPVLPNLNGMTDDKVPGVLIVRTDGPDVVATAAHEFAHEAIRARRLWGAMYRPLGKAGPRCDHVAYLIGDDVHRLRRHEYSPEALADGIHARWGGKGVVR